MAVTTSVNFSQVQTLITATKHPRKLDNSGRDDVHLNNNFVITIPLCAYVKSLSVMYSLWI